MRVDLALQRRVFRQMLRVTRIPHPHPRNGCGPCQGRRRIGRCFTSFGTVMERFDAIVIGVGVIGCSVAYQLARLGSKKVLVVERTQIGAGPSAQSSGILRTHYSVIENVRLAQASWAVFDDFANYLADEQASAGLVKCGYLIAAPEGPKLAPLPAAPPTHPRQGIT